MNKSLGRRLVAYIIDGFIVSLISSAIAFLPIFNKYSIKYNQYTDQLNEIANEVSKQPTKAKELLDDETMKQLSYNISKSGVYVTIITLVVSLGYYVGFQYYTGGKTGGKAIMKIEVVSTKSKKLEPKQLFIRSLIINNVFVDTLSLLLIVICSKSLYFNISTYVELLELGLFFVTVGMAIYSDEGISLHDKLAGTRVILSKEKELLAKRTKEAKVVKEKEK